MDGNQPLLPNNLDERNNELCDLVFGIPLLRDKILKYAVHEGGNISRTDACSCRLVQHSWLNSVNKSLVESGSTLFHISLGIRDYVSSRDSVLNQFIDAYSSPSPLLNSVPPFELCLYFHEEIDYTRSNQVLEKCLLGCSSGLVSLHLGFYHSCNYFHYNIPDNAAFPVLQNMYIRFYFRHRDDEKFKLWRTDVTSKTQSLLSKCEKLTFLCMAEQDTVVGGTVSDAFKTLRLPATLTKLQLGGKLVNAQMEQLMTDNTFPQLTALQLSLPHYLQDDTIYTICTVVRDTLQKLEISGGRSQDDGGKTRIHLPIMKRLASLKVTLCNWEWGEGIEDLGAGLPVLKKIEISLIAPALLRQLVLNNQFKCTEELAIDLVGHDATNFHENWTLSLSQFSRTFPSLSVLVIKSTVSYNAPHTFEAIFKHVTQLKKLRFHIYEDYDYSIVDASHFWSMVFLGMLPEEINAENVPPIRKMAELCELELQYTPCDKDSDAEEDTATRDTSGRLPDGVFEHGFLKMPNLFQVTLEGNMSVSHATAQKWEDAGRRLTLTGSNLYDE